MEEDAVEAAEDCVGRDGVVQAFEELETVQTPGLSDNHE